MKIRAISERQWKIVLCAALLLFGTICASAIANWQQVLVPGVAGELQFTTASPSGHVARVTQIATGSPMAALGVKVGDKVTFDKLSDGWRVAVGAHEPIGITIGEGGARQHVTLQAMEMGYIDPARSAFYVFVMANSLVALVLAGLIGLRRASSPSARMLALILLIETSFTSQFMPGGGLMAFAVVVLAPIVAIIAYGGFFLFSCRFPNDNSAHVPSWVRWASVPLLLCFVAYTLLAGASRYGWGGGLSVPQAIQPVIIVLVVMLSYVNLWHAYQSSSGVARQRVQWVGMAIGVRFASQALGTIPGLAFLDTPAFAESQIILTVLANIGLAYGILRHRVFDVGFAVNRALVYGIVSVVLLVSFGLMEWLAHHFVSPEEAEKNALLDAGIALGLYLVFHRLRHSVEHAVERLFFHKWHANEERLRRFVRQAAHISSPDALIEAYTAAMQRFTGEAGCALYRLSAAGYALVGASGLQVPPVAGIDDPLAVALRTELGAAMQADCDSMLPGALGLPMSFRGELQGFVLLGHKSNQGAYRPDEIAVLEYAAHQVGLDLQALRTEQLQAQVAGLQQELGVYAKAFELNRMAGLPESRAA